MKNLFYVLGILWIASVLLDIGIIHAQEGIVDINTAIKINSSTSPPTAGMIRWNDSNKDFEGYNGNMWVSLTLDGGSNINKTPLYGGISIVPNNDNANYGHSIDLLDGLLAVGVKGDRSVSIYRRVNNNWGLIHVIQDSTKADFGKKIQFIERPAPGYQDQLAIGSNVSIDFYTINNDQFIFAGSIAEDPGNEGYADNFVFYTGISEIGGVYDSHLHRYYLMQYGGTGTWSPCLIANLNPMGKEMAVRENVFVKQVLLNVSGVEVRINPCGSGSSIQFIDNAPNGALQDNFGGSLGLSDSLLLIGAPLWDYDTITNAGRVCIYKQNTANNFDYIGQVTSFAPEIDKVKSFGESIDILADRVVISARMDDLVVLFEFLLVDYNLIPQRVVRTETKADQYEIAIDNNGQLGIGLPLNAAGINPTQGVIMLY